MKVSLAAVATMVFFNVWAGSAKADTINQPTFESGDIWEYKTTDLWSSRVTSQYTKKVIGTLNDYVRFEYVAATNPPQTNEVTQRADLNTTVVFKGEKMEKTLYKWPLFPGKKWSFRYMDESGSGASARVTTYNTEAEVKDWETVDTPAGRIKAVKITYLTNWNNSQVSGRSTYTTWYSPQVKGAVQSTFETFGADGTPGERTTTQLMRFGTK